MDRRCGPARRYPERILSWVSGILAVTDDRVLEQVRNLGVSLAKACVVCDQAKAADLFRHLKHRASSVNVLVGDD